ncbi:MAG TPA: MOSC domain-containing protein [Capillimicrobium sp.]
MSGVVVAVSRRPTHRVSKDPVEAITLLEGLGVEGDAHAGETVQHRSRKRWRPHLPNLRQVHVLQAELHDELNAAGFEIAAGTMGENVLTRGVDLLALPTGARLRLGDAAVVEVTGLRNPCVQLDRLQPGLMEAVLDRGADGELVRRSGVMAVVVAGGVVRAGDAVAAELPAGPPEPLRPV